MELFGFKFQYVIPAKKLNHYISLGSNCFSRRVLTKYGIKPRKKQGELSCPFDLSITPLESLVLFLENNFEGFLDDIIWTQKDGVSTWFNEKYSFLFVHDSYLTLEELKTRYISRIENFKQISKNSESVKYIMTIYNRNFTSENLNRVYNALLKLRDNKAFKFIILSFVDDNFPDKDFPELNPNIYYNEYRVGNINEFGAKWVEPDYINPALIEAIAASVTI